MGVPARNTHVGGFRVWNMPYGINHFDVLPQLGRLRLDVKTPQAADDSRR
jgi:hypothetical protein